MVYSFIMMVLHRAILAWHHIGCHRLHVKSRSLVSLVSSHGSHVVRSSLLQRVFNHGRCLLIHRHLCTINNDEDTLETSKTDKVLQRVVESGHGNRMSPNEYADERKKMLKRRAENEDPTDGRIYSSSQLYHANLTFVQALESMEYMPNTLEAVEENLADFHDMKKGSVEFIYAMLARMDEKGIVPRVETLNHMLNVFPKDVHVTRKLLDAFWPISTPHSECAIDVLLRFEINNIIPDNDTSLITLNVFGHSSDPLRKVKILQRWLQYFIFEDPIERVVVPDDPVERRRLALSRISFHGAAFREHCNGEAVSSMTHEQMVAMQEHGPKSTAYITGPKLYWLGRTMIPFYTFTLTNNQNTNFLVSIACLDPTNDDALQKWIDDVQDTVDECATLPIFVTNQTELWDKWRQQAGELKDHDKDDTDEEQRNEKENT